MEQELANARRVAVALSVRMSERAGVLSEAHYFGHRLTKAELRDADEAREEQRRDDAELRRFVAWGLEHHRAAMLSWAEAACRMETSTACRTGWRETLARWRAGSDETDASAPPLSWLIAMWHRGG